MTEESLAIKMARVESKLDQLLTQQADYYSQLKEVRTDLHDLELQFKSMQGMLKLVGSLLAIAVPTVLGIIKLMGG